VKLAKPRFDFAVFTNQRDAMLAFWQGPSACPSRSCCRPAVATSSIGTA